jgi:phage baseplate assembly protein W
MASIDRYTGEPIDGWPEVMQGLTMCIATELGERVHRRQFGARQEGLLDKPGNEIYIIDHFVAINDAIRPRLVNGKQLGEPRFLLVKILVNGNESGVYTFEGQGIYFPYGHLGDFSVYEIKSFGA